MKKDPSSTPAKDAGKSTISGAKLIEGYTSRGAMQLGCIDFDDELARAIRAGYEPQGGIITTTGHEGYPCFHVLVVRRRR